MTRAHERLWKDLVSRLRARGLIDHSPMTPGEVASAATAAIGDDRVARFVDHYYLPRTYGSSRGQLTRDEAEELLASLDELPQLDTEGPETEAPGHRAADDGTRRGRRDRRLEGGTLARRAHGEPPAPPPRRASSKKKNKKRPAAERRRWPIRAWFARRARTLRSWSLRIAVSGLVAPNVAILVLLGLGVWRMPTDDGGGSWADARAWFESAETVASTVPWAIPFFESEAVDLQARSWRPDNDPDGSWERAVELFGRAAEMRGDAGHLSWQARSLHQRGLCLEPDDNPNGSWTSAAEDHARAAELAEEMGADDELARSLYALARCRRPDHDPSGSWGHAAELNARAAELFGRLEDPDWQASALCAQAHCVRPDNDPGGSWSRAAQLYAKAADIAEMDGDDDALADCLQWQAWCLRPDNNPEGSWRRAAELYARVERTGVASRLPDALRGRGRCLEPDNDPSGSWYEAEELYARSAEAARAIGSVTDEARAVDQCARCMLRRGRGNRTTLDRAAELYGRAANLWRRAGDVGERASSTYQQAYCLVDGRSANMTGRARALFEQALELAEQAGKYRLRDLARRFLD